MTWEECYILKPSNQLHGFLLHSHLTFSSCLLTFCAHSIRRGRICPLKTSKDEDVA